MKFIVEKEATEGIRIPSPALKLAALDGANKYEIHTLEKVVLVMKKQMTAQELIAAMDGLDTLTRELEQRLSAFCDYCDGEDCPYLEDDDEDDK